MTEEEMHRLARIMLEEAAGKLWPPRKCNRVDCKNLATHLVPGGDGNGAPLCDKHMLEWVQRPR